MSKDASRLAFVCVAAGLVAALPAGDAGATVVTSGCAQATSCTLGELFGGGSITVDDKRLGDWELDYLAPSGVQPDFDLIEVVGQDDGGLDPGPGLEFNGNGELAVTGTDFLDLTFLFSVTVLDPAFRIVGSSLELLMWDVEGGGGLGIEESVVRSDLTLLGSKRVGAPVGPEVLFDEIQFPGQTTLFVDTELVLQGFAVGDFAEIQMFEQRFSQVPEPGTLALLGVGLAGIAGMGRPRAERELRARRGTGTDTNRY